MPTLYELAIEQRKLLLARDNAVALRLINAYGVVGKDLDNRLSLLSSLIELRKANGKQVSVAWLNKEERFTTLLSEVESQIGQLGDLTRTETASLTKNSSITAISDASGLISRAAEDNGIVAQFNALPFRATEAIVSATQPTTALSRILDTFGAEAASRARNVLLVGISTGQGPRTVAGEFSRVTGASLSRSLLIARTENLRAYRDSSLIAYGESDLVKAWSWVGTKSLRSCASCLSLDGKVFSLETQFKSHPRCRCCPIPVLDSGPRARPLAADWFAEQSEEDQQKVIGIEGTKLFRGGKISLSDYVRETHSADYGGSYVKGSNEYALKNAAKRK